MSLESGTLLVGRYRIGEVLGKGGFGAVYLATDESFGLPCAVKENINVSPETERQFRREANLLANLRHPNLPRVTNHFVLGGQQYLVMDFVEGQDLKLRLAQSGPLPASEVLKWAGQICDALSYLHGRTPPVIHRDIKPANIKLTGAGDAMLVDFGIAKASAPGQQTTTSAMGLTPGFAPPEQYGMGGTDQRSDEYAFAATLYNLLTARIPPDSMERLLGNDSLKPLAALRPDLAPYVSAAIMRALTISPDQRFANVADFRAALMGEVAMEEIRPGVETAPAVSAGAAPVETEPAVTRRRPGVTQPAQPRRRRRSSTLAAFLVATLALGVLALMAWLGAPAVVSLFRAAVPAPQVTATALPTPIPTVTKATARPTITASATPALAEKESTPTPAASLAPRSTPTLEPTPVPTSELALISVSSAPYLASQMTLGMSGLAPFAVSADGKSVALTNAQGIDIYDIASGSLVKHLNAFWGNAAVLSVAFLPDSLLIQSPQVINRWDLQTGTFRKYNFTGHALYISPDRKRMVVPHDKYGQVIDIESGALLFNIGNPDSFYQFTPDDAHLAWTDPGRQAGKLNLVHWVNVATRQETLLAGHGKPLGALAISPDGKWLFSASGDMWETATGKLAAPFDCSADFVAISADSRVILGSDGELYEVATGKQIGRLGKAMNPSRLAFTPDGKYLIVQSVYGQVEVWAVGSQQVAQATSQPTAASAAATPVAEAITLSNTAHLRLQGWWGKDGLLEARLIRDADHTTGGQPATVFGDVYPHVAFSPDGRQFAGVNGAGVDIVDIATRQVVNRIVSQHRPREAVFLGDKFLLVASDSSVERWDLETQKQKQTYAMVGHALVASPDGQRFALQDDRFVYVVDVVTGKAPQASSDPHCDFLFTPDGRYLASTIGINVALWDVTTQQQNLLPGKLGVKTAGLAFSPDGKELISATGDIWDWQAGKWARKFAGGAGRIAISADGRLMVGDNGSLFDAVTGQLVGSLLDMRDLAEALVFALDGSQLLWHTARGQVYVWGLNEAVAAPTLAAPAPGAISAANAANLTLLGRWGKGKLYSAHWSPDEHYLAVNTSLNTLFYQGDNLTLVRPLWGATTLAIGAANEAVVVDAANLRLVEIASGRDVLTQPLPGVTVAAFSPDGQTLALAGRVTTTGKADGVALLNLSDGTLKILSQGWGTAKVALAAEFSPDGKYLAVSFRGTAWVWEVATGKQARPPIANVTLPARFSPDGQYLAYFTDRQMLIERVLTGYPMLKTNLDGTPYFPAGREIDPLVPISHRFLDDGRLRVVYQTQRGHQVTLAVWEVDAKTVPQRLHENMVSLDRLRGFYAASYDNDRVHTVPMLELSPAGNKLYSLTADGVVRVWDYKLGQQIAAAAPDYLENMALSPDGRTAALANATGGVDLLDLGSGLVSTTIAGNWYPKALVYDSPSVLLILYARSEEDDHLAALEVKRGAVIGDYDFSSKYYTDSHAFSMSLDGRLLAFWRVVNYQDVLSLFTLSPAQPLFALNKLNSAEYSTAFSPDGQYLLRVNGNKVEFWNIQSRQLEPAKTLTGKRAPLGNLVFSADGQRLVSASGDVWDMTTKKLLVSLPTKATQAALSPDGQVLVGNDGSVWNVATGQLVATLDGTLGPASHFAFSADGRHLVWQTKEGVVEVWGVKP